MNDTYGTNRPDPAPGITAQLAIDHAALAEKVNVFEARYGELPAAVDTKEDHDQFVDLIAQMRSTAKSIEATRVAEKDPYLRSERAVDGFFQPLIRRLDLKLEALAKDVKHYLDRKATDERARRLAEQRAREEEEAALRRAEDARRRKAEAAIREETKARHAAVADALAVQAEQAAAACVEAEDAVAEKPAEMARTRAESGTLSTLKQVWQFEVIDWDAVDLDLLRPYIKRDAIEAAIKAAVKMGVREIEGVMVFEGTGLTVR